MAGWRSPCLLLAPNPLLLCTSCSFVCHPVKELGGLYGSKVGRTAAATRGARLMRESPSPPCPRPPPATGAAPRDAAILYPKPRLLQKSRRGLAGLAGARREPGSSCRAAPRAGRAGGGQGAGTPGRPPPAPPGPWQPSEPQPSTAPRLTARPPPRLPRCPRPEPRGEAPGPAWPSPQQLGQSPQSPPRAPRPPARAPLGAAPCSPPGPGPLGRARGRCGQRGHEGIRRNERSWGYRRLGASPPHAALQLC